MVSEQLLGMKKPKRIAREARCPVMVASYLAPECERAELLAYRSFTGGWATTDHYNILADCRDLLTLAASAKKDESVLAVCDLALIALQNIADRWRELSKMGATGDELAALHVLVDVSKDFWNRGSGRLYVEAERRLTKARRGAMHEVRAPELR